MVKVNDNIVKFLREGLHRNLPLDYLKGVLVDRGFPSAEVERSSVAALDGSYMGGGSGVKPSYKKLILGLVIVLLFLSIFLFSFLRSGLTLNDSDLSGGVAISMSDSSLIIDAFGVKEKMLISSLGSSFVKIEFLGDVFVIDSESFREFDVNRDGVLDLRISLLFIDSGKPVFRFASI